METTRAELISVGTELLLGEITDTNAAYIARCLADLGINLFFKSTVGDNWLRLSTTLSVALSRSDLVILTGGLGPTRDDITKEVLAAVAGRPLVLNEEAWSAVQKRLRGRGRQITENNRRQAMLPEGAQVIPNPVGVAPGVWLELQGRLIICLPGVPAEMEAMMEQSVIPGLRKRTATEPLHSRILRFRGIGESALETELMDLIEKQTVPTLALYAGSSEVRLRMTCRAPSLEQAEVYFRPIEEEIRRRLHPYLYATGDSPIERLVGDALNERGATVGVAESCTGGLIGQRITAVPGSSVYFMGGVIAYHNDVKAEALRVPAEVLREHGAVSEPAARAMAEGVRTLLGVDYGLSVTGIAGPGGGTVEKPVGTVFIGCAHPTGTRVVHRIFHGARDVVRMKSADEALHLLYQVVLGRAEGEM